MQKGNTVLPGVALQRARYQEWVEAHKAASSAEDAVFKDSLAYLQGYQSAPTHALAQEAARLRQEAQAAFTAFLSEMDRQHSRIRHGQGSVNFALKMAGHAARQAAQDQGAGHTEG